MENNSLIPSIEKEIAACKKILAGLTAEKENIMPQLEKARYINADVIHLIERQYDDKIENKKMDIEDMETYVQGLLKKQAQNA
jgi:hypothetical protein